MGIQDEPISFYCEYGIRKPRRTGISVVEYFWVLWMCTQDWHS